MWNVRNIKKLCLVTFLAFSLLPKAVQAFIPQLSHHNRLTVRSGKSAQSAQSVDRFSYDAVGNILSASNEHAQLTFTYDAIDRLATANTMH